MGFKIGIFSDTHIGVFPLDPELNRDSFESFEESLQLLVKNGADIIIHAGDFYDRIDPAPWIRNKAIGILRSTITGKRSKIKVLEGKVNFEAEDVNIAVPLFIIHGTHDRPVGRPAAAPPFQDIVAAGYVNYLDIDPQNEFATRKVVLQKGSIKVSISGVGHRTEGYINQSISESGLPVSEGMMNICCVHNAIEGIIQTEGECIDLTPFSEMNFIISGHAHIPRLTKDGTIEALNHKELKNAKLLVLGATIATGIYPQEEGIKYAHLLEISGDEQKVNFKSFELESARRVFYGTVKVDELTIKEIRQKILDFLNKLPLSSLTKKPLVRIDLIGTLSPSTNKNDLKIEAISARYNNKVHNWADMIIPRDLYSEDELKHLEELKNSVQSGDALPAALTQFSRKLKQLKFKPKHFTPEELYETFSETKTAQTARRKVEIKLEETLKNEHH